MPYQTVSQEYPWEPGKRYRFEFTISRINFAGYSELSLVPDTILIPKVQGAVKAFAERAPFLEVRNWQLIGKQTVVIDVRALSQNPAILLPIIGICAGAFVVLFGISLVLDSASVFVKEGGEAVEKNTSLEIPLGGTDETGKPRTLKIPIVALIAVIALFPFLWSMRSR